MKFKKLISYTKEASPNSRLIDSEYDINLLYNIRSGQKVLHDIKSPKFSLHQSLNYLPDLVNSSVGHLFTLCCSDQFLNTFSTFNSSGYSSLDMEVLFKSKYYHFNYIIFSHPSNELIDFPICDFSYTKSSSLSVNPSKNIYFPTSFSSYKDFQEKEINFFNLRCDKIVFRKNIKLDFFWINLKIGGSSSGLYISKRMEDCLQSNKLTGYKTYDV